jgi:hypothetical protein
MALNQLSKKVRQHDDYSTAAPAPQAEGGYGTTSRDRPRTWRHRRTVISQTAIDDSKRPNGHRHPVTVHSPVEDFA